MYSCPFHYYFYGVYVTLRLSSDAPNHSAHDRSALFVSICCAAGAMATHESLLWRSDGVLPTMMIQRLGRIYEDRVSFFRDADADAEFTLYFSGNVSLGTIQQANFDLKPPRMSRLGAVLRQKLSAEMLVRSLANPLSWRSYGCSIQHAHNTKKIKVQ